MTPKTPKSGKQTGRAVLVTYSHAAEVLGGGKVVGHPSSDAEWIEIIRKGLKTRAFLSLADCLDMSESALCGSLGIATRTLDRRKSEKRFNPIESEKLVRLARVVSRAQDVLGDHVKGRTWVFRENRALGGQRPVDLLDTGFGFQQVIDVLGRIEHGVYS